MRRSFWLSAAAVSFVACASPAPFGAVKAASHNCTDLFAGAMATRHEVKGSWACLSPDIQDQFRSVGLEGDSGSRSWPPRTPSTARSATWGGCPTAVTSTR